MVIKRNSTIKISAHIYPSPFEVESRMLRVTKSLSKLNIFDKIVIFSLWSPNLSQIEELDDDRMVLRLRTIFDSLRNTIVGKPICLVAWFVKIIIEFRKRKFQCINCHSLTVLPLCVVIKKIYSVNLVYEPHELETEKANLKGLSQRIMKLVEKVMINYADLIIVVGNEIAAWYKNAYRLSNVEVVRNIPDVISINFKALLRNAKSNLQEKDDPIVFIYQGLITNGRGIQKILEAFARGKKKNKVIFLGRGPLETLVVKYALHHDNIKYLGAVDPSKLHLITKLADVGIALIENICLSYYYSLPNKVFEYLCHGLPVIVSDFPEMGKIVDRYGCGWKVKPEIPNSMDLINTISWSDIQIASSNAIRFSQENTWQNEEEKLYNAYVQSGTIRNKSL